VIPEDRPDVSIIVPVFRQERELAGCLKALDDQTYPAGRFEVVVVDNGLVPSACRMVDPPRFARWVHEPKPGSYAARNRGIDASRGTVIGFTDADCVPAPDWIACGVRAVRRFAGPGMVAGRIDLVFPDPERLTAAELFEAVFGFPQERYLQWGFSTTANMFTTSTAFDQVGPFDDRLMSGGDMEWGQRLRARGLPQAYADDVRVSHDARRTLGALCRKSVRVAGGLQQVADRRGEGTAGLLAHARRELVQLRRIRANLSDERLAGASRKARFAVVVWLVELLQVLERYRVHFGGIPRRA
jgi:GT2 family glycosyltransferase